MAWSWSRKSTSEPKRDRGCLGIDVNASRVRAAMGNASRNRILLLDDPNPDLPLAISMEKRTLEIGRAGLALSRRMPHFACAGYLPYLGQVQEWKGGRHTVDAAAALSLALARIAATCAAFDAKFLSLPAYLSVQQVARFNAIAVKSGLALKGAAAGALALAADRAGALLEDLPQESEAREDWIVPLRRSGKSPLPADAVVVDVDDYALSATHIRIEPGQVRMLATTVLPQLNAKAWKDRLLNSFADRCVRVCRRDPRDSADAEQLLYDQIDDSLDRVRAGQSVVLTVRAAHWYQDLELEPTDYDASCAPLARRSIEAIRQFIEGTEPPRAVWLTHDAGRLPGLAQTLHQNMCERTSVGVLRPESIAIAVANLGERWLGGELPNQHLDTTIPIAIKNPEAKTQSPAAPSNIPRAKNR